MRRYGTILNYSEIFIIIFLSILIVWINLFWNKEEIIKEIFYVLPTTEASVLSGVLLGDKNYIEKEIKEVFIDSGLVHLLVISGANLVLIANLVIENLSGWIHRKTAIIFGLLLSWSFVGLVGWQVGVLRAVLMTSVFYWCQFLGRKFNLWRALIFIFFLMLIIDYHFISDVSFWLSFAAFLGIVTSNKHQTFWVVLWTAPILSLIFGKFSIVSVISNLLTIEISKYIFIIGILGMFAYQIIPFFGQIIFWLLLPFLKVFVAIAMFFGDLSFSTLSIQINIYIVVLLYFFLFYFRIFKNKLL